MLCRRRVSEATVALSRTTTPMRPVTVLPVADAHETIQLRGAREDNLLDISLDIPDGG